jgi:hypothetical protein
LLPVSMLLQPMTFKPLCLACSSKITLIASTPTSDLGVKIIPVGVGVLGVGLGLWLMSGLELRVQKKI